MRGRRRVAGFLRAAASVITETGFDRATMSAIAERAGSCIGSLYQFFPNKRSVAEALRAQCVADVEQPWAELAREAASLDAHRLAQRMVSLQIDVVTSHPVVLALLDVPPTPRTTTLRQLVRGRIAAVLTAHRPRMPNAAALRTAAVVQQVSRGLLALYAQAAHDERAALVEEFEAVLTSYLLPKLDSRAHGAHRADSGMAADGRTDK
jgi:AcrR family transcriptional regulator